MVSKGSMVPSPKGSPMRRAHPGAALEQLEAGMRKITEEQWIDGPRVSRAKVAEARHLMREVNHVKQCETWVDGPKSQSCRSLTAGNLPAAAGSQTQGYGFMDAHKPSPTHISFFSNTGRNVTSISYILNFVLDVFINYAKSSIIKY